MEHPRTHSVTAAATTPGSTRNSSTSSGTHPHAHAHPGGAAKGKAKQGSCSSGAGGPTATVPTNTNTDNPTTSTSTTTSPTPPALGVSADRQHALALALGENSPALALAIGEGKDTAGSGESGESADSGTATPVALPGPRANPNLFKQFDSKTGQFLRTQAEVRAAASAGGVVSTGAGVSRREHSKEPVPPTQHMPHPQLPQPANKGNATTTPQFRLVSNFRNRSHSVPTILHSSLRRISNHGNVYHGGVNTPTIITHPMNPYGIGKKKQRAHAHAHGNALNTTSIRNAILLSQQAISAGEASASPSAQDKNGVGHRHTAGVKVKSAYSNKNIGINIHEIGRAHV